MALGTLGALKPDTLHQRAVEHLTDYLLSGNVGPGEFLPSEVELCKQLGISRAPLREAICVLEARGLVQRRHGVGIEVADRSHEAAVLSLRLLVQRNGSSLRDLLEARVGLECLIAEVAAVRATPAEIEALAAAIEPMRRPSTIEEYIDADLDFHLRLAEASHNVVFTSFVNAVRELLEESIRATYTVDGHTERRLHDHTRVLEAIRERDRAGAHAAMREHLRHTEEVLRYLGLVLNDEDAPRDEQAAGA